MTLSHISSGLGFNGWTIGTQMQKNNKTGSHYSWFITQCTMIHFYRNNSWSIDSSMLNVRVKKFWNVLLLSS